MKSELKNKNKSSIYLGQMLAVSVPPFHLNHRRSLHLSLMLVCLHGHEDL